MAVDDSGWQVVKPGNRKGRANLAAILAQEAAAGDQILAPTTSVLDVSAIAADHELLCARWKESSSFRELCAVISGNAAEHKEIKTAICLGLGSFDVRSNAPRRGRIQHDAHVQLEAFRTIVGILEKNGGHPIKCYAQEPSFGPSDRDYCTSLGIEVVDHPEAFRHVSSDAFVFAIHLPTLLWGRVFEKHLPALCVGTSLSSLEEQRATSDGNAPLQVVLDRTREMYSVADKYVLPRGDHDTRHTFHGADIVWVRKEADVAVQEDTVVMGR